MNEYSFTISYYSEATLLITMRRDSGYYEAECRHPMTADPTYGDHSLGESWFFFSGPDWSNERVFVRGASIRGVLDHVAELFNEGAAFYFEEEGDDTYYWFRQHLYIAFVFGHLPSREIRIPVVEDTEPKDL